jgi:hypothetical protein
MSLFMLSSDMKNQKNLDIELILNLTTILRFL